MATIVDKPRTVDRRKDPRRRIAVDLALALSDMNAGWADYERALEHLRSADQLSGGALSPRFARLRESWLDQMAIGD